MSFTFLDFQSLPVEIKGNITELIYWAVCFVSCLIRTVYNGMKYKSFNSQTSIIAFTKVCQVL